MSGSNLTNGSEKHKSLDVIRERVLVSQTRAEERRVQERIRAIQRRQRRMLWAAVFCCLIFWGVLIVLAV